MSSLEVVFKVGFDLFKVDWGIVCDRDFLVMVEPPLQKWQLEKHGKV